MAARDEFEVDRVVNLVNLHNNISLFLWQMIEPQMQKDWSTLCNAGQQGERLRLLTAARDTAFWTYERMRQDDLVPKAIRLSGAGKDQAARRRTIEIGVMNYGFYESCLVLHEWQQSGNQRFELGRAKGAVGALNFLEELQKARRSEDDYPTLETRCWIILTCTGRTNPDARLQATKDTLRMLLDRTVAWPGIDAAIQDDVRTRYTAAGFDLRDPQPLGP